MKPELEVQRAERARQILEDQLFKDAVAAIEAALLRGIAQSAFTDAVLREKLCQRYALLQDLLAQFRAHMETGQLARAQIEQQKWQDKLKAGARHLGLY